jgi:multicomponent Na+:H+ antiporter subunit G
MELGFVLQWLRFAVVAILMLFGLTTLVATTVGLFRFNYVLNRIHVAAKCDSLGLLLIFAALMLIYGLTAASLKLLLIIIFLWVAAPISVHLISHMEVLTNPQDGTEYEVVYYDPD